MGGRHGKITAALVLALAVVAARPCDGQPVKLAERAPDPHGSPRPARDATDVPRRTSTANR